VALLKTKACANIPLWNSAIVVVIGERAFEIPTRMKDLIARTAQLEQSAAGGQ
jgi:hypothetical protein